MAYPHTNSDNNLQSNSEIMQWEKPVLYKESWLKTADTPKGTGDSEDPFVFDQNATS